MSGGGGDGSSGWTNPWRKLKDTAKEVVSNPVGSILGGLAGGVVGGPVGTAGGAIVGAGVQADIGAQLAALKKGPGMPPPVPTRENSAADIQGAVKKATDDSAAYRGRASTILTSGRGLLDNPYTARRILLGT